MAGIPQGGVRRHLRQAPVKPLPWYAVAAIFAVFMACLAAAVLALNYGACTWMYWGKEALFHSTRAELCGQPPFGR
jgi:hypothetical protein